MVSIILRTISCTIDRRVWRDRCVIISSPEGWMSCNNLATITAYWLQATVLTDHHIVDILWNRKKGTYQSLDSQNVYTYILHGSTVTTKLYFYGDANQLDLNYFELVVAYFCCYSIQTNFTQCLKYKIVFYVCSCI